MNLPGVGPNPPQVGGEHGDDLDVLTLVVAAHVVDLTGLAALPAGFAFGALYQELGPSQALLASAIGVAAAVAAWLVITSNRNGGGVR